MSTPLLVFAGVFAATIAVRSLEASPATMHFEEEVKVLTNEGSFMTEVDDPVAMACRNEAKRGASDPSQCHTRKARLSH